MASDTVVRAPMDGQIKEGAARALADMGLPVFRRDPAAAGLRGGRESAAFRVPNAQARTAMAKLEEGGGQSFDTMAELMADRSAED